MSSRIDGKVANQSPRTRTGHVLCAKCQSIIPHPEYATLSAQDIGRFGLRHYIGKSQFIYESKSGRAVVYCSEYCRNKHNHRFSGAK
jgi:hypothetical protein